jgi:lipoprotein-anchoring transpeptidase ErfK/SrfK
MGSDGVSSTGRHAVDPVWRLSVTGGVAATVAVTGIFTAIMAVKPTSTPAAPNAAAVGSAVAKVDPAIPGTTRYPAAAPSGRASVAIARPNRVTKHSVTKHSVTKHSVTKHSVTKHSVTRSGATRSGATKSGAAGPGAGSAPKGAVSLVLTAADHKNCPAGAAACVDLARHITWIQGAGKVTFGPVQMEPGKPGSKHPTPPGTFQVSWKAGPAYVSTEYNDAMPWATFFAPGGIAFHGGSLTRWSHGCVHLTVANAHYYNEHLPVGAEVVVF